MARIEYLDREERELIESIEGAPAPGERLDPLDERALRERLHRAARRSPKDAKITLRLPKDDLVAIKAKARQLGVDYQPLIAELIHQFAKGELRRSG